MPSLLALFVAVALATTGVAQAAGQSWSTYLGNSWRSGYNGAETTINSATAPKLRVHWTHHAGGSVSNQPMLANGLVYWGTWDGWQQAANLTGGTAWVNYLGRTVDTQCSPVAVGPASTPTIATINNVSTLYTSGGNGEFYAMNAQTGKVIWQRSLGSSPSHFIWSSPAVYNGGVYVGMASFGDCPLVQGQLFELSAASGAILHVFNVVPSGCTGGGIWGSPTVDAGAGAIYVATGNAGGCRTAEPHAESIIKLRASDLAVLASWRIPQQEGVFDGDFGSTPTLFSANGHPMVGVASKNGLYYAFNRWAISAGPVWQARIAVGGSCPQCGSGSISPSAWDGVRLYIAGGNTTIDGTACAGSLRAVNPATGAFLWQRCLTGGPVLGAVTVTRGLAIVASGPNLMVVASATGVPLYQFHDPSGQPFWSAASIFNGVIYQGNMDGTLFAFGL